MSEPLVVLNIRLPVDLWNGLVARAEAEQRSKTAVMQRALRAYLATEPTAK